jgi:hypothetical protein
MRKAEVGIRKWEWGMRNEVKRRWGREGEAYPLDFNGYLLFAIRAW